MDTKALVTDRGFIEAFWTLLRSYRAAGSAISQRAVFEELNEVYLEEFGEPRFRTFDAFRKCRDRKYK